MLENFLDTGSLKMWGKEVLWRASCGHSLLRVSEESSTLTRPCVKNWSGRGTARNAIGEIPGPMVAQANKKAHPGEIERPGASSNRNVPAFGTGCPEDGDTNGPRKGRRPH